MQAEQRWQSKFREGVLQRSPDSITWVDRWLDESGSWIMRQRMNEPRQVARSPELKILRAYRAGIICLNRQYLDYPQNWDFKRFKLKDLDGFECNLCGASERDGALLHAHHIVFRSNSGTNSYRNLVTLCFQCHQAQHDHPISAAGGEAAGNAVEEVDESLDLLAAQAAVVLPQSFDQHAYAEVLPLFNQALHAFRRNGRSEREFFGFLIQVFGRSVGRYALCFAAESKSTSVWLTGDAVVDQKQA